MVQATSAQTGKMAAGMALYNFRPVYISTIHGRRHPRVIMNDKLRWQCSAGAVFTPAVQQHLSEAHSVAEMVKMLLSGRGNYGGYIVAIWKEYCSRGYDIAFVGQSIRKDYHIITFMVHLLLCLGPAQQWKYEKGRVTLSHEAILNQAGLLTLNEWKWCWYRINC